MAKPSQHNIINGGVGGALKKNPVVAQGRSVTPGKLIEEPVRSVEEPRSSHGRERAEEEPGRSRKEPGTSSEEPGRASEEPGPSSACSAGNIPTVHCVQVHVGPESEAANGAPTDASGSTSPDDATEAAVEARQLSPAKTSQLQRRRATCASSTCDTKV